MTWEDMIAEIEENKGCEDYNDCPIGDCIGCPFGPMGFGTCKPGEDFC